MNALLFSVFLGAHAYGISDQVHLRRVYNVAPAPDGESIAYVLRTVEANENRARTDLWLSSMDGKSQRRLTGHNENDGDPQWANKSRTLYFLSSRGGSNQIWKLDLDGGE